MGLVRKLLIFAAVDGLILQPSNRQSLQISYRDHRITSVTCDENEVGLEAFGVIGLLQVSNQAFLVSITQRQQVAQIYGKPIYVVTDVALTPLESQTAAQRSITQQAQARFDSESEDDDPDEDVVITDINTSAAEDVLVRKGSYGRLGKRTQQREETQAAALLPKLLRTTKMLLTSRSFYFSYEYDLTEGDFWWNRHLISPFIDIPSFALPVMQGFVGQKAFRARGAILSPSAIELTEYDQDDAYLLTLISRRSVKRAGLRYLRRGIDDEGNVANMVETTQILSDAGWKKPHTFIQIRGSIPVFFTQSPYSFKPIPQVQYSEEVNAAALTKHFAALEARYGKIKAVSLVEKHGPEAIVGGLYAKLAEGIDFEWFDFHAACKGMKYENVSQLLDKLNVEDQVLRINCMDCLDRTNVVQSAAASRALELQLRREGFELSEQNSEWFNALWADNGDAISRQYASSDAMKGDFTRTRKRNLQGALKDMGLSISRFYNGIVNDFFTQTTIDFLLGNATETIFDEFEAEMMSADPAVNLPKLRQQAIEVSHRLVIADDSEDFIAGWTLLTPHEANTLRTLPFEECVLLLTDAALYTCHFDWKLEKVVSFERIDVRHITGIQWGTYITSTLTNSQMNETRNVGLVIAYAETEKRVNTRTLQTAQALPKQIVALKAIRSNMEQEQIKNICNEIERVVVGKVPEQTLIKHQDIISLSEARTKTGIIERIGHNLKRLVWA